MTHLKAKQSSLIVPIMPREIPNMAAMLLFLVIYKREGGGEGGGGGD